MTSGTPSIQPPNVHTGGKPTTTRLRSTPIHQPSHPFPSQQNPTHNPHLSWPGQQPAERRLQLKAVGKQAPPPKHVQPQPSSTEGHHQPPDIPQVPHHSCANQRQQHKVVLLSLVLVNRGDLQGESDADTYTHIPVSIVVHMPLHGTVSGIDSLSHVAAVRSRRHVCMITNVSCARRFWRSYVCAKNIMLHGHPCSRLLAVPCVAVR